MKSDEVSPSSDATPAFFFPSFGTQISNRRHSTAVSRLVVSLKSRSEQLFLFNRNHHDCDSLSFPSLSMLAIELQFKNAHQTRITI